MFICFALTQKEGLSPNVVTLICILKFCGNIEGIVVSEYVCQMWRVCKFSESASRASYSRYSHLECTYWTVLNRRLKRNGFGKAQEVFDELRLSNVGLWISLIRGYVDNGQDICNRGLF